VRDKSVTPAHVGKNVLKCHITYLVIPAKAGIHLRCRRAGPLLRENSMLISSGDLKDIAADFDILLFEPLPG